MVQYNAMQSKLPQCNPKQIQARFWNGTICIAIFGFYISIKNTYQECIWVMLISITTQ